MKSPAAAESEMWALHLTAGIRILGWQQIISCFWNSEGRALEREPDPGVNSEAPQSRQSKVSHLWPVQMRDSLQLDFMKEPCWTLHSLPSFCGRAKRTGQQSGKSHSQVTPFKRKFMKLTNMLWKMLG